MRKYLAEYLIAKTMMSYTSSLIYFNEIWSGSCI